MEEKTGIITDQEIEAAFGDTHTSYSPAERRRLLEQGVLKGQAGWRDGHTLTQITIELGLISEQGGILKKGRRFLYESFKGDVFPDTKSKDDRIRELESELKKTVNESIEVIHDQGARIIVIEEEMQKFVNLHKEVKELAKELAKDKRTILYETICDSSVKEFKKLLDKGKS